MRLEYKILWFEDEEKWFNSIFPFISDYFDEIGFDLVIKRQGDDSNIDKCINEYECDLILMDFHLSGTKGDTLIEYIRSQQIFTEVIFYSQAGEEAVRDTIKKKGVDGVYCASRDLEEFEDKVKNVVYNTIKKVQDVNNMRGLVMAETSELDYMMLDVISTYLLTEAGNIKEKFEDYMFDITKDSIRSNLNKCERYKNERCVNELIYSPLFDTDKKRRAINELLNRLGCLDHNKQCFDDFKKEIQDLRNILAHVKAEINENGFKVLKSKVKGYEEVELNDEKYIDIRKSLRKHSSNLNSIQNYLAQKKEHVEQAAPRKE